MNVSDSPSDKDDKIDAAAAAAVESASPDANAQAAVTSDAADQGAKPELSLDDVIKASLKPAEAVADTPADDKGSEETGVEAVADEAVAEKTEAEKEAEEDAKVPFHKHPRWQKKLEKERELTAKVAQYEQEREPLVTKANQLDQIGSFMMQNSLVPEEMSAGMEIMALMKRDPVKALEALRPHLDALEVAAGIKFPRDIQEKVDAGHVDTEAAQELTRLRFESADKSAKAEVATVKLEQVNVQTLQTNMRSAVQTWEQDLKTRDPDYLHKQSFVIDRTRVLAQSNPPKSPEDAVALAKQAYDDVTRQFSRVVPRKAATTPSPTSDQSSTRSAPAPKSLEDIVRQNIAR